MKRIRKTPTDSAGKRAGRPKRRERRQDPYWPPEPPPWIDDLEASRAAMSGLIRVCPCCGQPSNRDPR